MQGRIDKAEWNDKGKLRLQIGGQWYTGKPPELADMVGQTITFEPQPWTIPNTNKVINFINDYGVMSGTTPADAAFNQAHAQYDPATAQAQQATQMGQPAAQVNTPYPDPGGSGYVQSNAPKAPQTDKDLTITALALVKCIEGITTPQQAYEKFNEMKRLLSGTSDVPFDDDLPY